MPAEQRFPVMGTTAHVLVVGSDAEALVKQGVARLVDLEHKWSRFLATSDVSRANAAAGSVIGVSPETVILVERGVVGWSRTAGAFDPAVLEAVRDAGYDRDFAAVADAAKSLRARSPQPSRGCAGIEWDSRASTVAFPRGVTFDAGGIGKGLAADLVAAELLASGARGVLVNVGGDLRVAGDPPNGASFDVAIEHPTRPGDETLRIGLVDGAVATTSRAKRSWETASGPAHHIIDPRTGRPARSRHIAVTVVAREAWWAEVVAKAIFVNEEGVGAGAGYGARVVTVDEDGVVSADAHLVGVAA